MRPLYHQDGGSSRMFGSELRLRGWRDVRSWQVGLKRFQCLLEGSPKRADCRDGTALHFGGVSRVLEKLFERGCEIFRPRDQLAAVVTLKHVVGLGKIEGVGPAQNARTEFYGFDRVLAAMDHKRAANEGKGGELIE